MCRLKAINHLNTSPIRDIYNTKIILKYLSIEPNVFFYFGSSQFMAMYLEVGGLDSSVGRALD